METELGGMARGNRSYWRKNYPMERFVEREPQAKNDFVVWCSDCNMSIGEKLFECEAMETAEYHFEDHGHATYILRECEMRVDPM